jgi:hypothetical protein
MPIGLQFSSVFKSLSLVFKSLRLGFSSPKSDSELSRVRRAQGQQQEEGNGRHLDQGKNSQNGDKKNPD